MARPTMADTAVELLSTHRTLTTEAIAQVVVERGQTRARDPIAAVRGAMDHDLRLHRLDDGAWTMPLHLLDGAVLTHELTEVEVSAGALAMDPDMTPLWRVLMVFRRTRRSELQVRTMEDAAALLGPEVRRAIEGPAGWLPSTPGAFLHLRLSAGRLLVTEGPRPDPAAARDAEERLVTSVRRCLERDVPRYDAPGAEDITHGVLQALADMPGILDLPLTPLGTLFRTAGLEVFGMEVGLPGTDWESRFWPRAWARDAADDDASDEHLEDDPDDELSSLAVAFDLADEEIDQLRRLLDAADGATGHEDQATLREMADDLEEPVLAEALAAKAWHSSAVGRVESLAERILAVTRPGHRAGPRYVLSVAAEAQERIEEAEQHLRACLTEDPGHLPAAFALARIEEDRGRYGDALGVLRRAGVSPDDPLFEFLETVTRPTSAKVGRNDPCPCGSGRKSKVCHPDGVALVRLSLGSRLIRKVHGWAEQPDNDARVHIILAASGADADHATIDRDDADPDTWLIQHALATDLLLYDHGGLDRFLRVRGPLLPPDELALARRWQASQRSLYEVRGVEPGVSVRLRDLLSEATVQVPDRSLSSQARILELVSARLLPDGSGQLLIGDAFLVPRTQRQRVRDLVEHGDGLDLLSWLVDPHVPVRLRTGAGHDLVFVTSVWQIKNPDRVRRALPIALRQDADDHFTWLVPRNGLDVVEGTITVRDREVTVEARSREGAAGLEAILRASALGMRLIRREEVDAEAALEQHRALSPRDRPSTPDLDPSAHPELAAAMDDLIRAHERRWVDESIPALGGMTPRRALTDARMRPELDAMLDDMDWQLRAAGGFGVMDPRRVRALLGIDQGKGHA